MRDAEEGNRAATSDRDEAFMTAQEAQEAVENLEIGGRNYILNSGSEISDSTALIARYALSEAMVSGEEYTVSLTLTPMETYSGTDELSQRLHELDDRLNAEAEAVQELIAQNARVAQNQDDYNAAYDAAVSRYEAIKAEREKVAADIRQRGIRRREFERFITELEKLPEVVSEFDETLWGSLVDYVTVGKDKTMVFTLLGGTEMKA